MSLEVVQQVGGDIRGKQFVVVLVVLVKNMGQFWVDCKVDFWVDDYVIFIQEIKCLFKVYWVYEYMNKGDLVVEYGDIEFVMKEYGQVEVMFFNNLEMKFWKVVNFVNIGFFLEVLFLFKIVFVGDFNWKKLMLRIIKNGLLIVDKGSLKQILVQQSL